MKCPVCTADFENGLAKCPVCECPVLYAHTDLTDEERKQYDDIIEAYKKKWNNVEISIDVYSNRRDGDLLKNKKESVTIARFKELSDGEIKWYDEKFARLSGPSNININVQNGTGTFSVGVNIDDPEVDEDSFWYLGVRRIDETSFCIALGNPEKFKLSRVISF